MFKKNKLLFNSVAAYTILIVILVIISGFVFKSYMFHYFQKEIGITSLGKLEIISGISELLNESVEKDALTLASDKSLNAISNVKTLYTGGNSIDEVYAVSRAIDILNNMKRNNHRIESIYVYLEDCDYVLSTDMSVHRTKEIMKNPWFCELITNPENHWSSGKKEGMTEKNVFSFVFNLRFMSDLHGWLVINIDENVICDLVNHSEYIQDGYILVADESGKVMSHMDKSVIGSNMGDAEYFQKIMGADESAGFFLQDMGGTKNLITYSKSPLYGWVYIGIFSMNTLMMNLNSVMFRISIVLFFLLAIGAGSVYIISSRQLHPLMMLINDIKKKGVFVSEKDNNDIKFVYNAFETLIRQVQNRAVNDRNDQINLYLRSLLLDDIPVRKDIGTLDETKMHLGIVISLDHYEIFSASCPPEEKVYLKKLILEIFSSAFSEKYKCVGCLLHYDIIVLILEAVDYTDLSMVKSTLKTTQQQLKATTGYSVSLGVGNAHEGFPGTRLSYQEALNPLQYRLVYGWECIVYFETESKRNDIFYYQEDRVDIMLNQIRSLQRDKAEEELKEILDKMMAQNIKFDNMWLFLNQIFSAFLEFLVASNIGIQDMLSEQTALGSPFYGKKTIIEIQEWFIEIINRIIDTLQFHKASSTSPIEQMFNYINNNFNRDISIEMIAEHVGLSYSHVRKLFKEETGKNIIDYINSLRIEKAKTLLLETQLTVSEIADAVGYTGTQGFLRNFRKKVGLTPTEFRNIEKFDDDVDKK